MNVAPADSAGLDLDKNIVGSQFWFWHIPQLKVTHIFENESFHI
jgi:hypothetical protein